MSPIKHYFSGGNTSIGFYSLFNEIEPNLERLYILLGSTVSLKSEMIQRLGGVLHEQGYSIEYLHSLHDVNEVEGLIVPDIHLGIIDGNSDHAVVPSFPGIRDLYIDFTDAWMPAMLNDQKVDILSLIRHRNDLRKHMFDRFALAKKVHDRKEKIYISAMNFTSANQIANQLNATIFNQYTKDDHIVGERHFYLGASTSNGAINYVENLTSQANKRYIIKGRSGSGKSTLMRKVAKRAQDHGLAVEFYHCSFDPHSIDMIIIPKLGVAMLDGTAPHVIDPSRESDEVIDMFTLAIDPTVEVNYAQELKEIDTNYRQHVLAAISLLKEMKALYSKIEAMHHSCIDLTIHEQIVQQWMTNIMDYVENHN